MEMRNGDGWCRLVGKKENKLNEKRRENTRVVIDGAAVNMSSNERINVIEPLALLNSGSYPCYASSETLSARPPLGHLFCCERVARVTGPQGGSQLGAPVACAARRTPMALVAIEAIMQMTDMASGHGFPSPGRPTSRNERQLVD